MRAALNMPEAGWRPEDGDKDELAELLLSKVGRMAAMLDDYFGMKIDENHVLRTLPLLLRQFHVPYCILIFPSI